MHRRITLAALLLWTCACQEAPEQGLERPPDSELALGAVLFDRHCQLCHGVTGAGNGPAAHLLYPPARDFGVGRFKLVSTENGVPTRQDLVDTLRRGMPGSAMPSFAWLPERDLQALARYVAHLAIEGMAFGLELQSESTGRPLSEDEARRLARERMTPGRPVERRLQLAWTPELERRGRELFVEHCASCHGQDGSGAAEPVRTEDGELNWARDLTAGIMKGGASEAELTRRIRAGMPGTTMPALNLADPADEAALVAYVRNLIPAAARERLVQKRFTLRAARLSGGLPTRPEDPRWDALGEVRLTLAPLSWRPDSIFHVSVRAAHDGENLALRLTWEDSTRDDVSSAELADAIAVQFSSEEAPPLFGMGSRDHPVNIWHWKSFRFADVARLSDRAGAAPHRRGEPALGPVGVLDSPVYRPAITSEADSVVAQGFESARRFSTEGVPTRAAATWGNGVWRVVFTRSVAPRAPGEVGFEPGRTAQLACAVWNGSAGDRDGSKSISTWQRFELEP